MLFWFERAQHISLSDKALIRRRKESWWGICWLLLLFREKLSFTEELLLKRSWIIRCRDPERTCRSLAPAPHNRLVEWLRAPSSSFFSIPLPHIYKSEGLCVLHIHILSWNIYMDDSITFSLYKQARAGFSPPEENNSIHHSYPNRDRMAHVSRQFGI